VSALATTIDGGPTPSRTKNLLGRLKRIQSAVPLHGRDPTARRSVYYGLIASTSTSPNRASWVRSPQKPLQSGVLAACCRAPGSPARSTIKYSVHDFILSRDALKVLTTKCGLTRKFQRLADRLRQSLRLLDWDNSFRPCSVLPSQDIGGTGFKVPISVHAGERVHGGGAHKMKAPACYSERLVNEMSERSRNDIVRFAAKGEGWPRKSKRRSLGGGNVPH